MSCATRLSSRAVLGSVAPTWAGPLKCTMRREQVVEPRCSDGAPLDKGLRRHGPPPVSAQMVLWTWGRGYTVADDTDRPKVRAPRSALVRTGGRVDKWTSGHVARRQDEPTAGGPERVAGRTDVPVCARRRVNLS